MSSSCTAESERTVRPVMFGNLRGAEKSTDDVVETKTLNFKRHRANVALNVPLVLVEHLLRIAS